MTTAGKPGWTFALRRDEDGAVEIDILDVVGDWAGPNAVTARGIVSALNSAQDAKSVRVRMNSGGGDVWEGLAIHSALAAHPAKVEAFVIGVAASITSIIAMAADTITMAPGSFMMVHNPWSIAMGDSSELRDTADYLDKIRDSLVGIYAKRTGRSDEEIRSLLDAETWMSAEEAVEQKFADRVDSGKKTKEPPRALAFASIADFRNVPEPLRASMQQVAPPEPQQNALPSPEGTAQTQPEPLGKETNPMPENNDSGITMTVARALALPVGCTEHDVLTRVAQLRELDAGVSALTGTSVVGESLGALRAMKDSADRLKSSEEKLAKVEAERDAQNFDALVNQALAERKMTPAEASFKREQFSKACVEGRGSAHVEELRGWVKVAAPRITAARTQPEQRSSENLTWNGKTYAELPYAQRAKLSKDEPELYRQMKSDFDAQASV
jgi:ATP-dependent Clp endopeptidase proteolytic subunit ClpP